MKKELALALRKKAEEVAQRFSNLSRARNFNGETFELLDLEPASESTALAIYRKTPGDKRALAFFYWLNSNGGYWQYFFVAETHLVGLERARERLREIDRENFGLNF